MTKKKSKSKIAENKGKKSITFTLSGLFSLALLGLIIVVWAFILGIILGRGYRPEILIPQLAQIMPSHEKKDVQEKDSRKKRVVLNPEELGFFEELKKDRVNLSSSTESKRNVQKDLNAEQRSDTSRNSEQKSINQPDKLFAYTYQVAAFQDKNRAQKLQAKLQTVGVQSYLKKVSKSTADWYRIYISFKGTTEDIRELKKSLNKLGIKKVIIRSKKIVNATY